MGPPGQGANSRPSGEPGRPEVPQSQREQHHPPSHGLQARAPARQRITCPAPIGLRTSARMNWVRHIQCYRARCSRTKHGAVHPAWNPLRAAGRVWPVQRGCGAGLNSRGVGAHASILRSRWVFRVHEDRWDKGEQPGEPRYPCGEHLDGQDVQWGGTGQGGRRSSPRVVRACRCSIAGVVVRTRVGRVQA
jgi:hypothetical protein